MRGRQGRRRKQLLDDLKEKRKYWKLKKGSTRSHPVENSLWKRLRTCRKTEYRMNESDRSANLTTELQLPSKISLHNYVYS
jgi:hypothetical protein